jgi:hypothetical protein
MATIVVERWLDFLQSEYLDDFIAGGGASVKFAVPMEAAVRVSLESGLLERASAAGYLTAHVSAAETRVHMLDQLFFRIAEQVPWRDLTERALLKLASVERYAAPAAGVAPLRERVAEANGVDPSEVTLRLRPLITSEVFKQSRLSRDFRVAATQLCSSALIGGPADESTTHDIEQWLTGRNRLIGAVKAYQIFTRINRTNARHVLESLLFWIRFAGYRGLAIVMDLARVTALSRRDAGLFYTKAAVLDVYEALREFVDGSGRMTGCLLVVTPDPEFLDQETNGRGLGVYGALNMRVYDEVHDQRLVNPLAALVRVVVGAP